MPEMGSQVSLRNARTSPWRDLQQENVMASRLIAHEDLKSKGIPYSKPHLWRLERAGKFPKRVPIGASRYGYVETEIDAYVDDLIKARDGEQAA